MEFNDVLQLYQEFKAKRGEDAFKHISELLAQVEKLYKEDYLNSSEAQALRDIGKTPDADLSWRSFKEHALEGTIADIIEDEVKSLGLALEKGDELEKTLPKNLSPELKLLREHLLVGYGKFGKHLPDADVIIYRPSGGHVIAVVSSKATLRERIAQTAYWRTKFSADPRLKHIKALLVTLDEDKTLTVKSPASKGRAIVEKDTDGGYVMSEEPVERSGKVKTLDEFISDLRRFSRQKH